MTVRMIPPGLGRPTNTDLEDAVAAAMAATFATANGWVLRTRPFSLGQLRRGSLRRRRGDFYDLTEAFDRPEFFMRRTPGDRLWRPVAIVVHNRGRAIPTAPGLRVDPLPASWVSRELRAWIVRRRQAEGARP